MILLQILDEAIGGGKDAEQTKTQNLETKYIIKESSIVPKTPCPPVDPYPLPSSHYKQPSLI